MDDVSLLARMGTNTFPSLVRKLDKKSDWGHASSPTIGRASTAAAKVFPRAKDAYSFYRVNSYDDLAKVVIGLNSNRNRLKEKMDLIAFTEAELLACDISISETQGKTTCKTANSMHVDAHSMSFDSFIGLCGNSMDGNRESFRISKTEVGNMLGFLEDLGCEAVPDNSNCSCQSPESCDVSYFSSHFAPFR